MQAPRVFRVSRGFAVISDQREILAAKARREIWGLQVRQVRPARSVRWVHRVISVRRDQEGFRGQPARQVRREPWGLRV